MGETFKDDLPEKVYCVEHKYEMSGGRLQVKGIRLCSNKEMVQETIEEYRSYEGFKDYPDGFYVKEYIIDKLYIDENIYKESNEEVLEEEAKDTSLNKVYTLFYQEDILDEDGDEDIYVKELGVFSTEKRAVESAEYCKNLPQMKDLPGKFVIGQDDFNIKAWEGGFVTYYYNVD